MGASSQPQFGAMRVTAGNWVRVCMSQWGMIVNVSINYLWQPHLNARVQDHKNLKSVALPSKLQIMFVKKPCSPCDRNRAEVHCIKN